MTLTAGQLIDRYRLEAPIAEGGMAVVWRVQHELLGSVHALKVLRSELLHSEDARDRFLAEGRIQAQLRHPNIAAVTDLVSEAGVAGLVMELLEGESLEARLARAGPLDLASVAEVFLPALDAIGHAHSFGVFHRDLKPSNLFLAALSRGRIRTVLLDFGIAKIAHDDRLARLRRGSTLHGTRMGTPAYMSPEQVKDARSVDARSDLYALGTILYEAAVGAPAFGAETEFELAQRIVAGHCEDPGRKLATDRQVLTEVIRRAMAVDPDHRFQDAAAFATALEDALHRGGLSKAATWSAAARGGEPRSATAGQVAAAESRALAARLGASPPAAPAGARAEAARATPAVAPAVAPTAPKRPDPALEDQLWSRATAPTATTAARSPGRVVDPFPPLPPPQARPSPDPRVPLPDTVRPAPVSRPTGPPALPVPMLIPSAGGGPVPLVEDRYYIGAMRGNVVPHPHGQSVRFSHAVVERRSGRWFVISHAVGMPVLIDGEKLAGEAELRGGTRVLVGEHLFRFEGSR